MASCVCIFYSAGMLFFFFLFFLFHFPKQHGEIGALTTKDHVLCTFKVNSPDVLSLTLTATTSLSLSTHMHIPQSISALCIVLILWGFILFFPPQFLYSEAFVNLLEAELCLIKATKTASALFSNSSVCTLKFHCLLSPCQTL